MAPSKAASCVDYDSAEDEEVPGTRKQANVAAKRTASHSSGLGKDKSDLAMPATELPPPPAPAPPTLPSSSPQEKNSDLASDSGYSSRTQTTTASADSVSSGRTSKTAKAPADNVAAPEPSKKRATVDGSAAAQPRPASKGSRVSSQASSSGKPKWVPCTDPNCDKCQRGRTLKPATPKKSAKSLAKSPAKQRPSASPNPKASGSKSASKPQPETSDRARPLSRPRANSSAVPRPRSMYDNFPGAGPLIMPGGRPPVAYHHRYPVMPARPGYMNAGGQMMYPERPGMPRFSTDTAMVSTRRRPRPSSLVGTPVVTYDVNTGPKVSARRPTAKIQYPEPEEEEEEEEEETDESYDEQEEESEEEFEEEFEESDGEDDDPQPTLNKGGDALRQMLASLDKRLEVNRNVVAQAKAHQATVEARAAHMKAQEEAKRLVLVKAQEDAKRRALVEEEAQRRTLLLKQLEEARRNMPPPATPALSSKYSMRTTSKPTHITYGNTAANDDDFEELRETIRNLGAHAATTQRRPSLAGSSDRTKASSYSHPSSSSTRLTVEHPTRGRRVSYVGSESRAELQQSLRELEKYMATRKREAATPALRQKQAPADLHQFIQKAVEEKLRELNLDSNPATTQEDKIQAAIAYQRQLEREMNPFQVTPLTESALRDRQGLLSEAGSSQRSSNESGTRISVGHRLTGPVSESGGVKISGDEVRMRVDPDRGFELEFEGRRLALNPTIDGLPELIITGRRETPYHSTRESTITTSKYGDTKSRAGGNKTATSSDRSATTVEDNRLVGAARLRRQLKRERAEREHERELERQLELEREERERERERRQREERERERREREREQRQREEQEHERERRRARDRADIRSERAYDDYDSEYTRTGQMRSSRNSAAAKAAAAAAKAADARYTPGPSERDDYQPPRAASAWPRYTGPGYPGFAPQGFTAPGYGTANSTGFQYGA